MNLSSFPIRLISAAVLTCAAGASHAAFSFSTATGANTAATYAAGLVQPSGIDTFGDLTINDGVGLSVASLNRSAGPVGYTVSTESELFAVQTNGIGGAGLSVANNTDTLTFSSFLLPTLNFGARFFLSDLSYGVNAGTMKVKATDMDGLTQEFTYNQTVNTSTSGATEPVFFRLGSTVALQSVQLISPLIATDSDGNPTSNPMVFGTADNVTVGAVPLPAAGWLLISGLAGMGLFKRRRS